MRVDRLLASPGMLLPGQRYVFITHPSQRPGLVAIGGCGGIARPTAYAAELRRWITSLDSAPAGGRVVGAVLLRRWGDPDPGGAPFQTVEGARVTLRGPVNREATAGAHGEYAFTGLPDGDYALAVQPPAGPMVADARFVLRASLSGGHAAAIVDAFVAVQGVITGRVRDERQQPVVGARVYLHVGPSVGAPEDHAFAFVRTGADGVYVFRHVPPGRYVTTLDDAYLPAYASFPATGAREIVMGWAETVNLAPLEGVKATEMLVDGHVLDEQGRPAEIGFRVEIVGPLGVYPKSGTDEGTDADGHFTLRFVPGLRYRFTFHTAAGTPHVVEQLVTGGVLRFMLP